MNIPSKLIQDAVNELARLPGIGKKSALRIALHLLRQPAGDTTRLATALDRMRMEIRFCKKCHNVSDTEYCSICSNPKRNPSIICVVENLRDIIAIENTNQYTGMYHVLGGVISPVEGIGPDALHIGTLIKRLEEESIEELIMALNPTMEGDTTIFYISRKVQHLPVKITTIARGISFGGELEYTDEMTLARSLINRQPYERYLVNNR